MAATTIGVEESAITLIDHADGGSERNRLITTGSILPHRRMAFILTPKNGEEIVINAWNWRPTLELLREAGLIDEDLFERMGTHGSMAEVDAATACRIADFIETRLRAMNPEQRVLYDLTITDRPKKPLVITPGTKTDEIDAIDVYSASYEWLVKLRDFSRTSGGFEVG